MLIISFSIGTVPYRTLFAHSLGTDYHCSRIKKFESKKKGLCMLTHEIGRGEVDPLRAAELGRCSDDTDTGWKAL